MAARIGEHSPVAEAPDMQHALRCSAQCIYATCAKGKRFTPACWAELSVRAYERICQPLGATEPFEGVTPFAADGPTGVGMIRVAR